MNQESQSEQPAYWSVQGLFHGAWMAAPLVPGTILFGLGFGTMAAQKGFTATEATFMSVIVFAGAAQFVAIEAWPSALTSGAVLTLLIVTAIVNLRYILVSASLRPWLGSLPAWQVYPSLFLLTEPTWLIGVRHRVKGGADVSIVVGSGLCFWLCWVLATATGHTFSSFVTNPQAVGLDLILPVFFAAMLIPLWKGLRHAAAWGVSGFVALGIAYPFPGWWFIVAGAIAGSASAAFIYADE